MINEKLSLEKDFQKKVEEFNFKNKEMSIIEHQFSVVTQDRDNLVVDNKKVKQKLEELEKEHEYLQSLVEQIEELNQIKNKNEVKFIINELNII